MAMPKKSEISGTVMSKVRTAQYSARKPISNGSFSPNNNKSEPIVQRLTPSRAHSRSPPGSVGSSPRTSPGLLAGHYAGCKFSEPPLPSALPLPPQHWMQATRSVMLPFRAPKPSDQHQDFSQQLKVLLKVQA